MRRVLAIKSLPNSSEKYKQRSADQYGIQGAEAIGAVVVTAVAPGS
jgi:hypothetical protein